MEALERVKAFFGKLSVKARVLLGVGVTAAIVFAVIAAIALNNLPYVTLFTGLTSAEITSISSYLEENGVTDYKVETNDTILVRRDQEAQLKAKLLMAGYPKSGFTYSTYTGMAGVLATESDRRTAYLFDLQDRMAAVIRCLDGVKDAHVTIALGEDRRYVLDSSNVISASASVMVEMQTGAKLTDEQAAAIRNLIAKSVQGLEIDEVSIADSNGNTYYGGDSASSSDASELKLYLEEQMNNRTRDAILRVLGPFFGEENVRIAVNSTVDVSRRVGENTTYTSPAGATEGQGVIGSQVYDREVVRDGGNAQGGVAGTTTNADIPTYVQNNVQVDGTESYIRDSGDNKYNYDTSKEQVERLAGTLTDMTISISINSSAAQGVNANSLYDHVGRAAGITTAQQNEKISILVQPFYNSTGTPDPDTGFKLPGWALYAAISGGVLFVLLLLILMLLGKRRKKKQRALLAAAQGVPVPMAMGDMQEAHADIMNVRTERSMELRKDIREFAETNPEIAAQLLKSWLRGGEEGNG